MAHKRLPNFVVAATLAAALMFATIASSAQAALRHLDGTIVSKNASSHSFKLKTQGGNRIRIRVNSSTDFERISGFSGLRVGIAIEVDAKKTAAGLLAKQIEPREGGAGGDGGPETDDPPNHP